MSSKSDSSFISCERFDPVPVDNNDYNVPNEPISENSVNSYFFCYCGDPAPIKMAWTVKNAGRRFIGCNNYRVKPCTFFEWVDKKKEPYQRVYEFYCKIQEHKREVERMKKIVAARESKIEELQKLYCKLEGSLKIEKMQKMELKKKNQKLEKDLMKKNLIGVFVLFVLFVFAVMVAKVFM